MKALAFVVVMFVRKWTVKVEWPILFAYGNKIKSELVSGIAPKSFIVLCSFVTVMHIT